MRYLRAVLLAAFMAAPLVGRADDARDKDKPKEPVRPITLKLVAKKAAYPLDLNGMTEEQFRQALKDAEKTGRYPKPPAVEMAVELANTSDKEVQFWVAGDPVQLTLSLKGPGAVTVTPRLAMTREFRVPRPMALAPGKTHTVAITSLQYGFRGVSQQAYWTQPGEYTLTAGLSTAISPVPPGLKADRGGFARVTLTSEPVKIKVEAK
jgi:hypothetical protein